MAVPDTDCYLLPDELRYEDAVLIEPTTIAIQACSRAEISKEDEVLIMGMGALGTRMLSIAKLSGAKIIAADVVDEKLEEAALGGADYTINLLKEDLDEKLKEYTTDAYGPTLSIDCACTKDSLGTLIRVTGNAGRVITMGFSVSPTEVTQFGITSKELDIRGSRLQNRKFQAAIDLVKAGKIDLDHKISHTFHFLAIEESMRIMPMGYWKGSAFAFMLDVLGAVLADGVGAADLDAATKGSCGGCSQVMIVIDPGKTMETEQMREIIRREAEYIKSAEPDEKGGSIHAPGEGSERFHAEHDQLGIFVDDGVWAEIRAL